MLYVLVLHRHNYQPRSYQTKTKCILLLKANCLHGNTISNSYKIPTLSNTFDKRYYTNKTDELIIFYCYILHCILSNIINHIMSSGNTWNIPNHTKDFAYRINFSIAILTSCSKFFFNKSWYFGLWDLNF